jgi:hypothetical protein
MDLHSVNRLDDAHLVEYLRASVHNALERLLR